MRSDFTGLSTVCFLLCFDTVGWATGRTLSVKPCFSNAQRLFFGAVIYHISNNLLFSTLKSRKYKSFSRSQSSLRMHLSRSSKVERSKRILTLQKAVSDTSRRYTRNLR